MTYNPNVPNGSQSPGLFPLQNNTNFARLKTIINADHVFNDTAQATDGLHRQVTLINRSNPSSVPAGSNSMIFGKAGSDNINDLWFYNATVNRQLNWREITGTVTISSSYTTVSPVPANCYGYVYLFRDISPEAYYISAGAWASNNSICNGYSYAQKFIAGSAPTQIIRLGFVGDGASGLNLRARNDNGAFYNGDWQFRIFYRLIS